MIISLIIALVLTFLICLMVKIQPRYIVLVAAISTLVVLILEKLFHMNERVGNLLRNNNLPIFKNSFVGKKNNNLKKLNNSLNPKPKSCGVMGCPMDRFITNKTGELIPEDMYNPEDCTNDGSCLIKPDENNLFPGFTRNQKIANQISNLDFRISKIENNVKNMKEDMGIHVEHFENNRSPQELNDIIQPFNRDVIKPYEFGAKLDNEINVQEMMSTDGICFHCKVGKCSGGVCKGVESGKVNGSNTHEVEQSSLALSAHPYTDEQPLIRTTNPGQHDFE